MSSYFVALDTSAISALYNPYDAMHEKAVEALSKLPYEVKFIIPATVQLELALVVGRLKNTALSKVAQDVADGLLLDVLQIDNNFCEEFKKFVGDTDLHLKTIDYTVLFVADQFAETLLTFDQKLDAIYKKMTSV